MLDDLKKDLIATACAAEKAGLCLHKSGNFSAWDETSASALITPSGVARDQLQPGQISQLNLEGQVLTWNGIDKPSSEALMHLAIYRARPDVKAIVHTHSPYASIFAVLKKPIPPIIYECSVLGQKSEIPVAAYARPGTPDLARLVAQELSTSDCCLLASHGSLSVGEDLDQALLRAIYLEEIAKLYYRCLSLSSPEDIPTLSGSELEKWAYPQEIRFSD